MKINYLKYLLLVPILLFSACNSEEVDENSNGEPVELRAVTTYEAQNHSFIPSFEISGSLNPSTETTIASEASGTVESIFYEEGAYVEAGSVLLSFKTSDNNARINLASAQQSLNNAQALYELTLASTKSSLKSAQLAVEQAEVSLYSATKSDSSTDVSIEEQIRSAEASLVTAQVNFELSEKNLADTKENLAKTEIDLLQNAENAYSTANVAFLASLQDSDEILGVTDQNEHANDEFDAVLSALNPSLLSVAKQQFKITNTTLSKLSGAFMDITDLDEANQNLQVAVEAGRSLRVLLNQVDEILQNTATSASFTKAELDVLKASIASSKTGLEAQLTVLTANAQAISDFVLESPQTLKSQDLAVQLAKSSLNQAEASLENVKAGLDVTKVGTTSQVSIAEKALEAAQAKLENTKYQNDIAIQNAKSARDNAARQLDSNSLAFSKLNVTSPTAGVVLEVMPDEGDTVNIGSPLFVVAEVNSLSLEGEIAPEDASQIKVGDLAKIYIAGKEVEQKGIISNIAASASSTTRRVKIKISVDNQEQKIFANTFARAEFLGQAQEGILSVPLVALFSKNPPTVFVVSEDNIVTKREIELGYRGLTFVEVVSGLEVGEVIVSENTLDLDSGDAVQIITTSEEEKKIIDKEDVSEEEIPG